MMMRLNQLLLITFIFALISCSKENNPCLKSTGKRASETRVLSGSIQSIQLEDNINLFITQDSVNEIRIEAGENLIDFIETKVDRGRLFLKNNNKCNFLRSFKKDVNVYLRIKDVDSIMCSGSGDLTFQNTFISENLKFNLSETTGDLDIDVNISDRLYINAHQAVSNFKAKGYVRYAILYNSGNGWYDMPELKSFYLKVNNRSTGDIIIGESNTMFVLIQSSGNIRYHGKPEVIELWELTGDGHLIAIDS